LCLGWQTGGRTSTLNVDYHYRELSHYRQTYCLGLQSETRPAGSGQPQVSGERCADRGADCCDLVFGLECLHTEVLSQRQLVQNIRRRRDRIAGIEQGPASLDRSGDEPERSGFIAGDLAVFAGSDGRFLYTIVSRKYLGCFGVSKARLERGGIGLGDLSVLFEPVSDPFHSRLKRPVVQPIHQSQRPEILATVDFLTGDLYFVSQRRPVHCGNGYLEHPVVLKRPIFQRIRSVPGLLQVVFSKGIGIYYQDAAFLEISEIDSQRSRVHGDQNIRLVAGCANVVAGEV